MPQSLPKPQRVLPPASVGLTAPAVRTLGCVGYLNAKPLIEGLQGRPDPIVRFDVPSRMLSLLESNQVDVALCPVIDYYRCRLPLAVLPVGGIGCRGATLTVRLFSRVPFESVTRVHVDCDSHTSVALLKVIWFQRYGRGLVTVPLGGAAPRRPPVDPEAVLLIGDKVVTDQPAEDRYPYQLDLGQAWHELTSLPFVFAVWMCHRDAELGDLPRLLASQRDHNARCIGPIADRHAAEHGWDAGLARHYLGRLIRYEVGAEELAAIGRFAEMAHALGLVGDPIPLRIHG
jgi:chorismate dehydratase